MGKFRTLLKPGIHLIVVDKDGEEVAYWNCKHDLDTGFILIDRMTQTLHFDYIPPESYFKSQRRK